MVNALSSHKDAENIVADKNFKWFNYNKNDDGEDLTAQEICNKLWNDMLLQSTTWCAVDSNNLRAKMLGIEIPVGGSFDKYVQLDIVQLDELVIEINAALAALAV